MSNPDLYDEVKEGIFGELGGGDPEVDYATVEALKAFGSYLRSRRWYTVDEMLQEMREMMLSPCGDFRDEFDEAISGH